MLVLRNYWAKIEILYLYEFHKHVEKLKCMRVYTLYNNKDSFVKSKWWILFDQQKNLI